MRIAVLLLGALVLAGCAAGRNTVSTVTSTKTVTVQMRPQALISARRTRAISARSPRLRKPTRAAQLSGLVGGAKTPKLIERSPQASGSPSTSTG